MKPDEFRKHARILRNQGATRVRVATKTVELECEFAPAEKPEAPERAPAIGFAVHAAEDADVEYERKGRRK